MMNTYQKRLDKEKGARDVQKEQQSQWQKNDVEFQKQMASYVFYTTAIDGVPKAMLKNGDVLKVGDAIILSDGYGEVNALASIKIDSKGEIDGKRIKFTEPSPFETKNEYLVDGKMHYFEAKLSKNQVILADGELYTILEIDKNTKELKVDKKETKKMRAVYPVYKKESNGKRVIAHYMNWGEAYGVVLQKRFSGEKGVFL